MQENIMEEKLDRVLHLLAMLQIQMRNMEQRMTTRMILREEEDRERLPLKEEGFLLEDRDFMIHTR